MMTPRSPSPSGSRPAMPRAPPARRGAARRVDDAAALPVLERLEPRHAERRSGEAAEGADQVDLHGQLELVDRIAFQLARRLVAPHGLGGIGDARAIDQDPPLTVRLAGLCGGGLGPRR